MAVTPRKDSLFSKLKGIVIGTPSRLSDALKAGELGEEYEQYDGLLKEQEADAIVFAFAESGIKNTDIVRKAFDDWRTLQSAAEGKEALSGSTEEIARDLISNHRTSDPLAVALFDRIMPVLCESDSPMGADARIRMFGRIHQDYVNALHQHKITYNTPAAELAALRQPFIASYDKLFAQMEAHGQDASGWKAEVGNIKSQYMNEILDSIENPPNPRLIEHRAAYLANAARTAKHTTGLNIEAYEPRMNRLGAMFHPAPEKRAEHLSGLLSRELDRSYSEPALEQIEAMIARKNECLNPMRADQALKAYLDTPSLCIDVNTKEPTRQAKFLAEQMNQGRADILEVMIPHESEMERAGFPLKIFANPDKPEHASNHIVLASAALALMKKITKFTPQKIQTTLEGLHMSEDAFAYERDQSSHYSQLPQVTPSEREIWVEHAFDSTSIYAAMQRSSAQIGVYGVNAVLNSEGPARETAISALRKAAGIIQDYTAAIESEVRLTRERYNAVTENDPPSMAEITNFYKTRREPTVATLENVSSLNVTMVKRAFAEAIRDALPQTNKETAQKLKKIYDLFKTPEELAAENRESHVMRCLPMESVEVSLSPVRQ